MFLVGVTIVLYYFGPRNRECTNFLDGNGFVCTYGPRPYWILMVGFVVAGLLWWSSTRVKADA